MNYPLTTILPHLPPNFTNFLQSFRFLNTLHLLNPLRNQTSFSSALFFTPPFQYLFPEALPAPFSQPSLHKHLINISSPSMHHFPKLAHGIHSFPQIHNDYAIILNHHKPIPPTKIYQHKLRRIYIYFHPAAPLITPKHSKNLLLFPT